MSRDLAHDVWQATIDKASTAIVVIDTCTTRPFRGARSGTHRAFGTVVDSKHGIILTGRHVIGEGPTESRAIFHMGAGESSITPVYVDPKSNFCLARYEVANVRDIDVQQMEMKPELIATNLDVCLFDDCGQSLSVVAGVISGKDCNPPYWDALTPYIQISSRSYGASGSPVITKDGYAVALATGGAFSTEYCLPLDGPKRALEAFLSGKSMMRGTIQSNWILESRVDCYARGLDATIFQKYCPGGGGLLKASEILSEGSSDELIQEADLLLQVNDQIVSSLAAFENAIDSAVGSNITLRVWRHGQPHELQVCVKDLSSLVPRQIFEYADCFFEDLSYKTALEHGLPLRGVLISSGNLPLRNPGYGNCLVESFDNHPTPDLGTFIEVARTIPDQARVRIVYRALDSSTAIPQVITMDSRCWLTPMRLRTPANNWRSEDIELQLGASTPLTALEKRNLLTSPIADEQMRSIPYAVRVVAMMPQKINGAPGNRMDFLGIIMNKIEGFVIIPQAIVPSTMCSLQIVFGESVEIPAIKRYQSALGFAVAQYDPELIKGTTYAAVLSDKGLGVDDTTTIYGLHCDLQRRRAVKATVKNIEPLLSAPQMPLFHHPVHVEVLHLEERSGCGFGLLMDDDGKLEGLWVPFNLDGGVEYVGMPLAALRPDFEQLQQGRLPKEPRLLNVLLDKICKNDAFGVKEDVPSPYLVRVNVAPCGQRALETGDIILRHGDGLITKVSDLHDITDEDLPLTILRAGIEKKVETPIVPLSSYLVKTVVWFCGAQLEPAHSLIPFATRDLYSEIYSSARYQSGSPAEMYELPRRHFITHVNHEATKNIDSFISVIRSIPEKRYCQITCMSFQGIAKTVSVKPNFRDFPTLIAREDQEKCQWYVEELSGREHF